MELTTIANYTHQQLSLYQNTNYLDQPIKISSHLAAQGRGLIGEKKNALLLYLQYLIYQLFITIFLSTLHYPYLEFDENCTSFSVWME